MSLKIKICENTRLYAKVIRIVYFVCCIISHTIVYEITSLSPHGQRTTHWLPTYCYYHLAGVWAERGMNSVVAGHLTKINGTKTAHHTHRPCQSLHAQLLTCQSHGLNTGPSCGLSCDLLLTYFGFIKQQSTA